MKILNNLSNTSNHFERFKELLQTNDELIIVSPFLMENFKSFFKTVDLKHLKSITVLTTLKPNDIEQFKKIRSFVSLVDTLKRIRLNIHVNNLLHGKVYIFKNEGYNKIGIVSSANFTDSGLKINHEWGIEFDNILILNELEEQLRINSFPKILEDDIINFMYELDEYKRINKPIEENSPINLNLIDKIKNNTNKNIDKKNFIDSKGIKTKKYIRSPEEKAKSLELINNYYKNKKSRDKAFAKFYEMLLEYYKIHGHSYVEVHDPKEPIEGWSISLKNLTRDILYKEDFKNNLDENQLQLLKNVNFQLERKIKGIPTSDRLSLAIERLLTERKKNPSFDIKSFRKLVKTDTKFKDEIVLPLRKLIVNDRIKLESDDQLKINQLNDLGFDWGSKTGTNFELLLEHRKKHNTFIVNYHDYEDNKLLYFWTYKKGRLKKFIEEHKISDEWIKELKELGYQVDK